MSGTTLFVRKCVPTNVRTYIEDSFSIFTCVRCPGTNKSIFFNFDLCPDINRIHFFRILLVSGHNSNPYFAVIISVRTLYFAEFQMDKFILYFIKFYSFTRYKLLCSYNSSSSSDTGSEEE